MSSFPISVPSCIVNDLLGYAGEQYWDAAPSLDSWDTLFYSRNFASVNADRPRRHLSKLLTYPITIASVLHRLGPYAGARGGLDGRTTHEGKRSLAAIHQYAHPPVGAEPSATGRNTHTPIRLFILGARAESTLPPHVWEQICFLFPFTRFEIYFIGPQAALPSGVESAITKATEEAKLKPEQRPEVSDDAADTPTSSLTTKGNRKIYDVPTPSLPSPMLARGRVKSDLYGVPSFRLPVSHTLTLTTLKAHHQDVHDQFGPFDPFTDVFVAMCPGYGFPSTQTAPGEANPDGSPILMAQREWHDSLVSIMKTKCPLIVTGFSPRDVERDVASLDRVDELRGEYDILVRPGKNPFSSLKWEAGDFDPRVMVRVNWGVWVVRGKSLDVEVHDGERERGVTQAAEE